ncbi:MAG: chemotaxis protein CheR [Acidobacteria bacterium]|jgi:chemotaxis protein methyltransferase CheR|nr:chemotaxis protein CheR [Acidobacteriota bacterium]MDP7479003.1 CheR family methyltransferase [Vicinamibacterales bacterium]MDP7691314.1 CheR family methyltransferase [Vicinamibacterales bacterium]HJN42801.1 CheR family methyltransferase [Vicinamibacterales bacterium]|tara:strand:+ start:824 stop:1663 length:840 start_codon:yes stop_codon:yes gene_type:complete
MGISDSDFNFVRTFIHNRAGIVLEPGKEYLADARLSPLLRQSSFKNLSELVAELRTNSFSPWNSKVVDVLTTNETSFFRDHAPFEALRTYVIPELIAARRCEKRLNIWYAASSTGQEPYSVAMLLAEHIPELATWDVSHLATDISTEALDRARQGRYAQFETNRGLPATYLEKYFDRDGLEWVLKDYIRKAVRFEELNLNKAWPALPSMDIVMMRNVMIYFDLESKRDILGKVAHLLRPDGCLFLGAAETTMHFDERFSQARRDRSGCYRCDMQYKQTG